MGPGSSLAAAAAVVSAAASWIATCWCTASRFAGDAKDLIELCKGLVPSCPDSSPPQEPRPESASWLLTGLVVGLVVGSLLGGSVSYLAVTRRAPALRPAPACLDVGRGAAADAKGLGDESSEADWVPRRLTRPGRCLA